MIFPALPYCKLLYQPSLQKQLSLSRASHCSGVLWLMGNKETKILHSNPAWKGWGFSLAFHIGSGEWENGGLGRRGLGRGGIGGVGVLGGW